MKSTICKMYRLKKNPSNYSEQNTKVKRRGLKRNSRKRIDQLDGN
jgi:hypothetical protein